MSDEDDDERVADDDGSNLPRTITATISCATADALLTELTPHASRLYKLEGAPEYRDPGANWIFRGQSNSKWKLIPNALRPDAFDVFAGPHNARAGWNDLAERRRDWELDLVRQFVALADRHGFAIPDEDPHIRDGRLHGSLASWAINEPTYSAFPPPGLLATFALAQHYGIPTRLLDWTWKPLVAAYFAARGAVTSSGPKKPDPNKRLLHRLALMEKGAPGCMNRLGLKDDEIELVKHSIAPLPTSLSVFALRTQTQEIFRELMIDPRLYVITSATASNPNLRAQGGLFTLLQPTGSDVDPPDLRSLLDGLEPSIPLDSNTRNHFPLLVELTMPIKEARLLLFKLEALGVSSAIVDPGLSGVVAAIKEQRYYEW